MLEAIAAMVVVLAIGFLMAHAFRSDKTLSHDYSGELGRGRRRLPRNQRRPLIALARIGRLGSCRPIQHDCGDDRISSVIDNAIRVLT
jgi:hypothetical protein